MLGCRPTWKDYATSLYQQCSQAALTVGSHTYASVEVSSTGTQGVPPTLRSWVWMEVSGAAKKKAAVGSNYFNNMALAGEKSQWLKEIDKVLG